MAKETDDLPPGLQEEATIWAEEQHLCNLQRDDETLRNTDDEKQRSLARPGDPDLITEAEAQKLYGPAIVKYSTRKQGFIVRPNIKRDLADSRSSSESLSPPLLGGKDPLKVDRDLVAYLRPQNKDGEDAVIVIRSCSGHGQERAIILPHMAFAHYGMYPLVSVHYPFSFVFARNYWGGIENAFIAIDMTTTIPEVAVQILFVTEQPPTLETFPEQIGGGCLLSTRGVRRFRVPGLPGEVVVRDNVPVMFVQKLDGWEPVTIPEDIAKEGEEVVLSKSRPVMALAHVKDHLGWVIDMYRVDQWRCVLPQVVLNDLFESTNASTKHAGTITCVRVLCVDYFNVVFGFRYSSYKHDHVAVISVGGLLKTNLCGQTVRNLFAIPGMAMDDETLRVSVNEDCDVLLATKTRVFLGIKGQVYSVHNDVVDACPLEWEHNVHFYARGLVFVFETLDKTRSTQVFMNYYEIDSKGVVVSKEREKHVDPMHWKHNDYELVFEPDAAQPQIADMCHVVAPDQACYQITPHCYFGYIGVDFDDGDVVDVVAQEPNDSIGDEPEVLRKADADGLWGLLVLDRKDPPTSLAMVVENERCSVCYRSEPILTCVCQKYFYCSLQCALLGHRNHLKYRRHHATKNQKDTARLLMECTNPSKRKKTVYPCQH